MKKNFDEMTDAEFVRFWKFVGLVVVPIALVGGFAWGYVEDMVEHVDSGPNYSSYEEMSTQQLLDFARSIPYILKRYPDRSTLTKWDVMDMDVAIRARLELGKKVWKDASAIERERFLPKELVAFGPSTDLEQEIGRLAVIYNTGDLGQIGRDPKVTEANRAEISKTLGSYSKALRSMNVEVSEPGQLLQRLTSGEALYGPRVKMGPSMPASPTNRPTTTGTLRSWHRQSGGATSTGGGWPLLVAPVRLAGSSVPGTG